MLAPDFHGLEAYGAQDSMDALLSSLTFIILRVDVTVSSRWTEC